MRINQAGSRRAGGKQAGAAIGVLLLATLGGCMSMSVRDTYQMSASQMSASDEWLTTANADKVVNAMAAKGMIPATIDCRFDTTTPGQPAYASKFTWKRAPANTRYHWEIGDPAYLASNEVKANRVGLRRVFAKVVRDPASGQKVGCSIWVS